MEDIANDDFTVNKFFKDQQIKELEKEVQSLEEQLTKKRNELKLIKR